MATGDCVLSLAVEGGDTRSVTLTSAVRVKAKLATSVAAGHGSSDVAWAVFEVNKLANVILAQANGQLQREASWTPSEFTAATEE
jgi:hypothetical protein